MRTTVTLALLLFAACASAQNMTEQAAMEQPPLCGEDAEAAVVRIDIDSEAKTLYPKECAVRSGTTVVWWENGSAAFETAFSAGTPDAKGQKKFRSAKVGGHHEAKFKARNVNARQSYNYDATIDGETIDPTIIVDP